MAVPKSKITRSRRGMRRSHDALTSDAYVESKETGELADLIILILKQVCIKVDKF